MRSYSDLPDCATYIVTEQSVDDVLQFYSYYFLWFCIPFRPFEYFGFIYVVTKGGVGWNFDHIEFDPWGLYLQAVLNLWICGVGGGVKVCSARFVSDFYYS